MTTLQRFEAKDPAESVPLTYDFSKGLAQTEQLIGTPVVTIRVVYGTDPSPLLVLAGLNSYDATLQKYFVPVQGGVDQTDYDIVVTAQTSNPEKTLVLGCILPVRVQ